MKYNIWHVNDMLVFNDLDHRGWISKGFELTPKCLTSSGVDDLNNVSDMLSLYLANVVSPLRVQFQWSVDSDYSKELNRYDSETERLDMNPWSYHARKRLYYDLNTAIKNNLLRRERLYLYVSTPIMASSSYKSEDIKKYHQEIISKYEQLFAVEFTKIKTTLGSLCNQVKEMTSLDLHRHYYKFFNPSFRTRTEECIDGLMDLNEPLNNCFQSEGYGEKKSEYGFFLDNNYHNIIAIKRLPRQYIPSMVLSLTTLGITDYTITTNLIPLSTDVELQKAEKVLQRLEGDAISEKKHSLLTSIDNVRDQINELASGEIFPFGIEVYIRLWDKEKATLRDKTEIIKTAINRMQSTNYYVAVNPATSRNMLNQTIPGWIFGNYTYFQQKSNNRCVADLIPFSGTFTGYLDQAEAIFRGDNGNLVGIRTNINGTPQHAAIYGTSGTGKSVTTFDILTQTSPYYAVKIIFEEGESYSYFTKLHGQRPLIIQPDAGITINYFDTAGSPLTSEFILAASFLVLQMAGLHGGNEKDRALTLARISEYIETLYNATFKDYHQDIETPYSTILRHAFAVAQYQESAEKDFISAWNEYYDGFNNNNKYFCDLHNNATEDQLTDFSMSKSGKHIVRNAFFAFLPKDKFPTHSMLQMTMMNQPEEHHPDEEIKDLATLLAPWKAGGSYGNLFDGVTNIDFNPSQLEKGSVVQFELGKLPKSAEVLKRIAVFALYNYVKAAIVTLPRSWQKFIHFEEAGRFMQIDGATEIMKEGYEQMRKMNATVYCSIQQFEKIRGTELEKTISNNAKCSYIFKLLSTGDINNLADEKPLSPVACQQIQGFVAPENLPKENRYSSFMLCYDGGAPVVGVGQYYASPESIYISNTDGALFEARENELKGLYGQELLNQIMTTVYEKETKQNQEN